MFLVNLTIGYFGNKLQAESLHLNFHMILKCRLLFACIYPKSLYLSTIWVYLSLQIIRRYVLIVGWLSPDLAHTPLLINWNIRSAQDKLQCSRSLWGSLMTDLSVGKKIGWVVFEKKKFFCGFKILYGIRTSTSKILWSKQWFKRFPGWILPKDGIFNF